MRVGFALSAACAGLSILALGGRYSAALDLISHVAPWLVVGAILGSLAAFGTGPGTRKIILVLTAITVLSAGAVIWPEFTRSTGPSLPGNAADQIKVIQFNAWRGNLHGPEIVEWLVKEQPDIVAIEEATPQLRDLIVSRTGWSVAGAAGADMIFSRRPYTIMHRPKAVPGTRLTWVNATYPSRSGPFEVVITHFARPMLADHKGQSHALRAVVSALPRDRMILTGDFNLAPWSFELRRDDVEFGLLRRDVAVATWPASLSRGRWNAPIGLIPIDHIYAGPGWATTSLRRGPRLGSDHYPLVITLAPVIPR